MFKDAGYKKDLPLTVMDKLLIYSPKRTSRVRYTFRLVFHDLLMIPYHITTDLDEFRSSDLPRLIYSDKITSDDLFIQSHGLLFERGVDNLDIETVDFEGTTAIFAVHNKQSAFPFDVFSAIFYLVSRYEEYLPFVRDKHGRFTAGLSKSVEWNILQKPVVNIWTLKIREILLEKYPDLQFTERKYKFVPTYDIDSAFAYAQKGLVRSVGGYLLDLKNFQWRDIVQRTRSIFNQEKDPYNTFLPFRKMDSKHLDRTLEYC